MEQRRLEKKLTDDLKQKNKMVSEKTKNLIKSKDTCPSTCQRMARESDVTRKLQIIDDRVDENDILLRSFQDSEQQTEKQLENIKCKTKAIESGIEELKRKILLNKSNKSRLKRVTESRKNREIDSTTARGTETTPELDRNRSLQLVPVSKGRPNPTDQQKHDLRVVKREINDMAKLETTRTPQNHACLPQTQKQYGSELTWRIYSSSEKQKMLRLDHFDVDAAQTVLLIDTSESMTENGAWEDTCAFVNDYLTGIEEMSTVNNVTGERIALVTFGSIITVRQHLTHEVQSVRRAFDRIQLGGPTPMFAGLLLLNAVLILKSYDANGIDVFPKVILITDGKPTETSLIAGPDVTSPSSDQEAQSTILSFAESLLSSEIDVFCVPVGQCQDENEFLKLFVEMSDGIMVSHNDGRTVARRLFLTMEAANELSSRMPFILPGYYWDQEQNMLCRDNTTLSDRTAKMDIHMRSKRKEEESRARTVAEIFRDTNDPKLPRVGTRVIRGPDGDPATLSDDDGPGTVTGHLIDPGCLAVHWDKTGRYEKCSYGKNNTYDVIIVDELRKVSEGTRMAIGCAVVPGKDWIPIPNSRSSTMRGVCVGYNDENGFTKVKWEDGTNVDYLCTEIDEKVVLLRGDQHRTGHRAIGPPATQRPRRNKNLK